MHILLIDPVTTAGTIAVEKRRKLRKGIGYPGLGLATVAALTPLDITVRIIDESVEEIPFAAKPDLVGISVQAPTAPYAYRLADRFRAEGRTVVLGGIHASLNSEESASHADAVVIGEAELTWPQLLRDFQQGQLKKVYRAAGLADLDSSPRIPRQLLSLKNYRMPWVVQASKGCPYGCEFCSLHCYVGRVPRYRRVESVRQEIEDIPAGRILFADDNLYADRNYALQLMTALLPLQKKWAAEASWHIAYDEEVLSLAKQSGCVGMFIGFDSINRQYKMEKVPDSDDVEGIYIRAIRNIQRHGIAVVAAFVFGLDQDDTTVFEKSLQVALKGGANLVNFSVLVPYPGTPIFHRLKAEGRIIEWDWTKYISPNVCFEPKRMTPAQLKAGILTVQKKFYSYSNILRSSLQTARRLGWAKGLFSFSLNVSQKRNWGKGAAEQPNG
jgi:radical SAM superfamily enzyme YgiQ (UPF0313 family)